VCGNSELAGHVPHRRTTILPTAVDCEYFYPTSIAPTEESTVGWVGHSSNLRSLEAIGGSLKEIAGRHPRFKLVVVSDREPRLEGVPVVYRPWSLDREIDNLGGMAIGLMPLEDSPWTRGKCAFKLLQYMALGLPSIASPVGMNNEVIERGENGLLASTDAEWVMCLDDLLRDPDLRLRLGRAGRKTVLDRFDLPLVSRRLVDIIRDLSGGRDGKPTETGH
jgi:glycosyltransferase involved in cell wall biosynthesis